MTDTSKTRDIWEDVIREFPKMWMQDEYQGYEGKYWSLPPRKVLPKPYHKPHPPMWYAAGNTTSWEMCALKGLGVLGFSVGNIAELSPVLKAYKEAIPNADPIGAYVNDNVMVTIAAYVAEDRQEARRSYVDAKPNYLVSNVFRYHDTFPHPEAIPYWPEMLPEATYDDIDYLTSAGTVIIGDPHDALSQAQAWADAGTDQLVFGVGPAPLEETLRTIKLIGEHVIPKIDPDPVHSTTRYRDAAAAAMK
jgi:alkanesulfonate monooxygenase SsuD/methylene tetrahydromethanopterin reductase-like flavin-dependent oxidoreductase (luciferase family)